MSFFTKLFGGLRGKRGPCRDAQQALHKLRDTEEMLTRKQELLKRQIADELLTAKNCGPKHKKQALLSLKRKHLYEKQLSQINGTLATVKFQIRSLMMSARERE